MKMHLFKHYYIANPDLYYLLYDELKISPQEMTLIYLYGDIGLGKTTLVRSFLKYLSISNSVTSPTFTLINQYGGLSNPVYHYDMYRIKSPHELLEIGIDHYFNQKGLHFIEWPDRFESHLPTPDYKIYFHMLDNGRLIKIYKYYEK